MTRYVRSSPAFFSEPHTDHTTRTVQPCWTFPFAHNYGFFVSIGEDAISRNTTGWGLDPC